jgi:YVTN family beta-propeller protein
VSSGTIGTGITAGSGPVAVAVTNDSTGSWPNQVFANTYVICCNFLGASLTVIETSNNTVYTPVTLPAGTYPYAVAVAPNNSVAYVADIQNGVLYPITSIASGGTFSVGSPITVGSSPSALAFTPDSKHLYVSNKGSNTVSVITVATNTVLRTVSLASGSSPLGLAATPNPPTVLNPASSTDFTIWVCCNGAIGSSRSTTAPARSGPR